jgi:hypothetical protein
MDPLIGLGGLGITLCTYFTVMAVLWVGTSTELG